MIFNLFSNKHCLHTRTRRLTRQRITDVLVVLVGFKPFRCKECGVRFYKYQAAPNLLLWVSVASYVFFVLMMMTLLFIMLILVQQL